MNKHKIMDGEIIFEKVYLKTHKFILREQSLFRAGEGVDDFLTQTQR